MRSSGARSLRRAAQSGRNSGYIGVLLGDHDHDEGDAAAGQERGAAQQLVARRRKRRIGNGLAAAIPPIERLRVLAEKIQPSRFADHHLRHRRNAEHHRPRPVVEVNELRAHAEAVVEVALESCRIGAQRRDAVRHRRPRLERAVLEDVDRAGRAQRSRQRDDDAGDEQRGERVPEPRWARTVGEISWRWSRRHARTGSR